MGTFTGIFIARISKGRTIKEFLITTIVIPTLATVIWFSVFANSAFDIVANGDQAHLMFSLHYLFF
jgi:glycine betaine transporter